MGWKLKRWSSLQCGIRDVLDLRYGELERRRCCSKDESDGDRAVVIGSGGAEQKRQQVGDNLHVPLRQLCVAAKRWVVVVGWRKVASTREFSALPTRREMPLSEC